MKRFLQAGHADRIQIISTISVRYEWVNLRVLGWVLQKYVLRQHMVSFECKTVCCAQEGQRWERQSSEGS